MRKIAGMVLVGDPEYIYHDFSSEVLSVYIY